jgi:hypothetical protein
MHHPSPKTIADAKAVLKRARKARQEARGQRVSHAAAKPDRGRETDPGFLAYLRRQLCEARHLGGCSGPIEAAHVRYSDASKGARNPGMQRRNHDRHANPLCRGHHQGDQHSRSERAFWADVGKDAYDTAAAHYAAYLSGGETVREVGP